MSTDTHIKFDGVEGESQHAEHKGSIEVLSWSWGMLNQGNTSGSGSAGGKADPQNFTFTHLYDKASTVLAKKCAQGIHFSEVTVTSRKSGDGQKDFWKAVMKEVFIASVQSSGASGGDMHETVSMTYGSIDMSYKAQDAKGTPGGEVKFGYNAKTKVTT